MPQSPLLVDFAVALPISVGIAYLLARLILAIFGRRLSLSITAMTLISLLGFSVGIFLAGMFLYGQRLWMPTTLLLTFGTSLGLSFLVASIVALTQRGVGDADISALLRAGESERAEFKETARWNVRESKKDARMELAIAKTIAAFLNSRGGVLVIGANDAGEAVGLDRDLATLRTPDHDRFELWLRDMLSTALGRNAAALPRIRFVDVPPQGTVVCAVECPPSPKPVFLAASGGGSTTELWIRVGNSTRALPVDEALEYVQRHWRPTLASVLTGRPAG